MTRLSLLHVIFYVLFLLRFVYFVLFCMFGAGGCISGYKM